MADNSFGSGWRQRWLTGRWCAPLFRRLGQRPYCVFCHGAWGFIAATLFFLIAAWIRLLFGPVSLGPFASALSGALADALPPGLVMTYDKAEVEWSREDGRVTLAVLGATVLENSGATIIQAPKAHIDLAPAALFKGKVSVQRVTLVGTRLTIVHTRQGAWRLGNDDELLNRLRERFSGGNGQTSLKRFAVRHADIVLVDEATGLKIAATDAELRLSHPKKAKEDLDLRLKMALSIAGQPAELNATVHLPDGDAPVSGSVAVKGVQMAALGGGKQHTFLRHAQMVADITGHFVSRSGRLISADARLESRGRLLLPSATVPVNVRRFLLVARYDSSKRLVRLTEGLVDADRIRGRLTGSALLQPATDGSLEHIRLDVTAENFFLDIPGMFGKPVEYGLIDLKGDWQQKTKRFELVSLKTSGAPFQVSLAGVIDLAGAAPAIHLDGSLASLGVRDLVRYWPMTLAHGARSWVDRSMPSGRIGPLSIGIHLPAGALSAPTLPRDSLALSFPIDGATAVYINGLTPITEAQGTAVLTGTDFTINVRSMRVGALSVTSGRFHVPDINAPVQVGQVDVSMQGGVTDVLKLIDMKPLGYPTRFGIAPAAASGAAQVHLKLDIPLHHDVSVDSIKIDVGVDAKGFGLALGPHFRLTDGLVHFAITNKNMTISGSTGIGGSAGRLNVSGSEDFNTARAVTTRIAIKGTLDNAARRSLNLQLDEYIKGPVLVSGTLIGHSGALKQGALSLDLTPATITVDQVGMSKPAGFVVSGNLGIVFGARSMPSAIALRLAGQGTSITANAQFAPDGVLSGLQIPVFRNGQKNDFSLTMARTAQMTDIDVQGRLMDGSRLMRRSGGGTSAASAGAGGLRIAAKLERMSLRNGVTISGLDFGYAVNGVGRLAAAHLTGTIGKASLQGALTQNVAGRSLDVSVGDAGQLFRGLYGVGGFKGGKLTVSAFFPGRATAPLTRDANAPDFKGKLTVKDITAVDQPFLARLFTAGSLGGMVNLMQGEGIAITTLELPFTARNDVISLHDMRAVGPAIGLTGEGYIDRPQSSIAIKGTLVPLYSLNSVLGNIPLIGSVLTSKEGEGIFGMSYEVSGNLEEPAIRVNPLSVLAPGIFRRLFEGRIPNALQAPSNNQNYAR